MRRLHATLLAFALTGPALAGDDHTHIAEKDGVSVVHAWAAATAGSEAFVHFEVHNDGSAPVTLTGGRTDLATGTDLVGIARKDGVATWEILPGLPIGPGARMDLEPGALALRLTGLTAPLAEGTDLDLTVIFDRLTLGIEAEVGAADATAHSHAGHRH